MNRATILELDAATQSEREGDAWTSFAGAASANEFCVSWLALQCAQIEGVAAALLLLRDEEGKSFVPAAIWPDAGRDVNYLSAAAQHSLEARRGLVHGLNEAEHEGLAPGSVHVAYPVESGGEVMGVVVLDVVMRPEPQLQAVLRQIFWGVGWLEAFVRRRQAQHDAEALARSAVTLDLVQAAEEQYGLDHAAIAVVNELATHCQAERVSLGMVQRRRLRLRAISRTAWFEHKSQLAECIENAMEECVDQEAVAAYPLLVPARAKVSVAQRDLGLRSGARAVMSIPLMSGGRAIGAITLERAAPFDEQGVRLCRAAGELLGPALAAKLLQERWFAGRLVDSVAGWCDKLLGPRHPALKLGAGLALVALAFVTLVDGEFRVSAKTVVEGAVQRAAVAPFEGYIAEAYVRAGERVRQGQILAILDDRDLRLEQARWESEREQAARKYREALAKHDRAATRILGAQLNQADAQLALAEEKLARTELVAPFDGVVVSGDLSQMLGAPVEQGKVLFELAPLDAYRVVLKVDERDIAYVATGAPGELALTGLTGPNRPFTVKTVTSVSTPQDGRNFFRVEAQLADASTLLRPGMEGVGKIVAGERSYIWIWTRGFVDWLRISLWTWMP